MPEPNQKTKRHYLVVNLEIAKKIGDSGDFGDSNAQKAELERILSDKKKGDSENHSVIPVILDEDNGKNPDSESPESLDEKAVIQEVISHNVDIASGSESRITESPESPIKQALSKTPSDRESDF